jgi:23S rRNA pseudouridine1911/1915/1917 synthase
MKLDFKIAEEAGVRVDVYLQQQVNDLSRSRIQSLIKEGHVLVNEKGTKASYHLRCGDHLSLTVPAAVPVEIKAQDIPMTVLYEDADLIVIHKASGMVVHPAAGNLDGTLVNALLHHCDDLSGIGGETRPGIVHRLDKDTSGCMVVAKNDITHRKLTVAFAERNIHKIYLAVIQGEPTMAEGRIQNKIGRHPSDRKKMAVAKNDEGKEAVTEWRWLGTFKGYGLIECRLLTGRTHQIRVHMKEALKYPILGDIIYGNQKSVIKAERLMLHAWKLSFEHPKTGKTMNFEAEVPAVFAPWIEAWKLREAELE